MAGGPSFGCIILTQGNRPDQLDRAVRSVLAQTGVTIQVVVVWNGLAARTAWDGVTAVQLATNVGIPAGRNAGVPAVQGEYLLFMDDDAELSTSWMLARIGARFAASAGIGAVQPRVQDPDGRPPPRRWVPRLVVGNPAASGDICALWEGCVILRRSVFAETGGWPGDFWYMHEGIDLAWRVWDSGFRVRYEGSLTVWHPAVPAARHPSGIRFAARNRVWLARRNLPLPIAAIYLINWALITATRIRSRSALGETVRGVLDGLRVPCGPRRPLRWRTIGRMTRAGRPPIL